MKKGIFFIFFATVLSGISAEISSPVVDFSDRLAAKADTVDAVFTNSVTVTGTVVSTTATIGGAYAGQRSGVYSYYQTDGSLGQVFTNANSYYLWHETQPDQWFISSVYLNNLAADTIALSEGAAYTTTGAVVDVTMTGTPSYSSTPASITIDGVSVAKSDGSNLATNFAENAGIVDLIENWTQAFVTNLVVQTVEEGTESNVVSGAGVAAGLAGKASTQSVALVETDIQTLGDVTNSYVVVNGNVLLYDYDEYDGGDGEGHPVYGTGELAVADGMWTVKSYGRSLTNTIVGYFPPMLGWCDYETGAPTNLNIRFVPGSVAIEEAARNNAVSNLWPAVSNRVESLVYTTNSVGSSYITNGVLYLGTNTATDADLAAHTGSTNNPHSVTKAQVGLGNVDNTADLDKPVSTAQALTNSALLAAIGSKASTVDPVFINSIAVQGVTISTNGIVTGSDAGSSAGIYYFAGYESGHSDESFPFWTNSSGRVLWNDLLTQFYMGSWTISDAGFGATVFCYDGSIWYDLDLYKPVDIALDQEPFYEERTGKIYSGEFHGDLYGLLKSTGNENYKIGDSAGGTNTYELEGDYTGNPLGKGNLYIGRNSGASSRGNYNTFVGDSAGLGLGDEDVEAFSGNTCIGFSAGRSAKSSCSTFVGKGAGWGATNSYLVVFENFGSDSQSRDTPTTNSMFYFQGASIGRLLLGRPSGSIDIRGTNVIIGQPSGSIDIRGTNVITGTIVTNVVQQKDSNGFLTNVVIQGVTGKIVK